MVKYAAQVLEDRNENLLHLLSEIKDGARSVTGFVQSKHGVQTVDEGAKHLEQPLRHKYTGLFNGNSTTYIREVDANARKTTDNKKMLRMSGVRKLQEGLGAAIPMISSAIAGYKLHDVWNQCIADGIVDSNDFLELGLTMASSVGPLPQRIVASQMASVIDAENGEELCEAESIVENAQSMGGEEGGLIEVVNGVFSSISDIFSGF